VHCATGVNLHAPALMSLNTPLVPSDTPVPTADPRNAGHPKGLYTLFFTEMWERFSYYGMRVLLVLFMTAAIDEGGLGFAVGKSVLIYGYYTMAVYMLSVFGGFVADKIIGARQTVLVGGIIITTGHFTMALSSIYTFYAGLALVAVGTGLLKPNISTMVGSLYSANDERRDAGFSIFYMGINIGALFGGILTGFLAQHQWFKDWLTNRGFDPYHCWHWAFALAGIGMTFGLITYVRNMRRLDHIGVAPDLTTPTRVRNLILSFVGLAALGGLVWISSKFPVVVGMLGIVITASVIYYAITGGQEGRHVAAIFVLFAVSIVFFAVFEQAGSSINLFARDFTDTTLFGFTFPSSWFQSVNPIFVMILAPLFAWLWTRLGSRQPSSPMKFFFGLVFVGLSFLLMIPAAKLATEGLVSPWWLLGLFFLQTLGELCLSPVGLSTVTKLAPVKLVGVMMGGWFLATSMGNFLSGYLARTFGEGSSDGGLEVFFKEQAIFVLIAAVILLALVPGVKKLMGNIR